MACGIGGGMDSGVDNSMDCGGAGGMAVVVAVDCLDSDEAGGIYWPLRG